MVALLRWFDRGLNGLLVAVIFCSSAAIVSLITFLILSRFVFGWSVVGVLELSTLSALWLYMMGAVMATRNGEHIAVDYLSQSLRSRRMRALHDLVVSAVVLLLGVFFIRLALDMLDWALRRPQVTPGLGIPLLASEAAIMVAAVLVALYKLRDVTRAVLTLVFDPDGEG